MESAQEPAMELDFEDLKQQAYQAALLIYRRSQDWVSFFREVLGIGGVVRRMFPDEGALTAFEKTREYTEIQIMLSRLRYATRDDYEEPTRVITVRLPKSLHESLRVEAHMHHTSMNKLCITKLLQVVDEEMDPREIRRHGTSEKDEIGAEKPEEQ